MSYQAWSTEQEAYLRGHAHEGAEACRDGIKKVSGINRSVAATRRHMNRMGLSAIRHEVCPECGRASKKLVGRPPVCTSCHQKKVLEAYRKRIMLEMRDVEKEASDARKEYDRERAHRSRRKRAR